MGHNAAWQQRTFDGSFGPAGLLVHCLAHLVRNAFHWRSGKCCLSLMELLWDDPPTTRPTPWTAARC